MQSCNFTSLPHVINRNCIKFKPTCNIYSHVLVSHICDIIYQKPNCAQKTQKEKVLFSNWSSNMRTANIEGLTDTCKFQPETPGKITSALGNVPTTKWLLQTIQKLKASNQTDVPWKKQSIPNGSTYKRYNTVRYKQIGMGSTTTRTKAKSHRKSDSDQRQIQIEVWNSTQILSLISLFT